MSFTDEGRDGGMLSVWIIAEGGEGEGGGRDVSERFGEGASQARGTRLEILVRHADSKHCTTAVPTRSKIKIVFTKSPWNDS